nr:UDP-glucuronosyltransferase 2A1-like [Nothobranchius furzeri]
MTRSPPGATALRKGNYDVLLADPIYSRSNLTAEILGIPLVFSLRFSIANNWERLCGQPPAPPSYVPGAVSRLTDKMNFSVRTWNFLFYVLQDLVLDQFITNMFVFSGTPTSACKMMGNADIWLLRTCWDFDFPRPLLPNFKFVGGIHCKPAKPLPKLPDLNPIEHLWDVVERELRALDVRPTHLPTGRCYPVNMADISKECFQHLVGSMPRRIKAVLKVKVGQTPY